MLEEALVVLVVSVLAVPAADEVLALSESEAKTSVTKLLPSFARRLLVDRDRMGMPKAEATGPRIPVALGMAFVNR